MLLGAFAITPLSISIICSRILTSIMSYCNLLKLRNFTRKRSNCSTLISASPTTNPISNNRWRVEGPGIPCFPGKAGRTERRPVFINDGPNQRQGQKEVNVRKSSGCICNVAFYVFINPGNLDFKPVSVHLFVRSIESICSL